MRTTNTFALIATGLLAAGASSPAATIIYGLTATNQIVSFNSAAPGLITSTAVISQPGIIDIDGYPANGQLYGMNASGAAFIINPTTGVATPAVTPGGSVGTVTDFDFNPATDRFRIFSTGDQNFRMVPDFTTNNPGKAGAVTADGTFSNTAFELVGNAYTNNFDTQGGATTLYSIDTATNALVVHSVAPQFNTVAAVGTGLGIGEVGSAVGFDVAQDNVAYLSNGNTLYTVDLATGAATSIGPVTGAPNLVSIAAAVPEPGTAMLVSLALAGLVLRRRQA